MYEKKKILILGMGKSGVSAARLLKKDGAYVTIHDSKVDQPAPLIQGLMKLEIAVSLGETVDSIYEGINLVIKSPGIPYTSDMIVEANKRNIPIVTDIEVAYQFLKAPIIAITGSNGKTTTTTLIGKILEKEKKVAVAGNIGIPMTEEHVLNDGNDFVVAELSSFQLMGTNKFQPKIATLINITPAHLDYHGNFEEYKKAKFELFKNQTSDDYAVLNMESEACKEVSQKIASSIFWFSTKQEVKNGSFIKDGYIVFKNEHVEEKVMEINKVALKGEHNLENILASVIIAKLAGATNHAISEVIETFTGVEHRLEYVKKINNVVYYNNSKATNPEAAITSLKAFDEPIVHIVGGLDRGIDFEELRPIYKTKKMKALIAYGQTKEKFEKIAKEMNIPVYIVEDVISSVEKANEIAESGDIVLLAPACASWDMYPSFEVRGKLFKEAVDSL